MDIRVRPFETSDYPRYEAIHNAIYPFHPLSLESSRHEDWWFGRTRFKQKKYTAEADGFVIGVGSFLHEVFSYKPTVFNLRVEVDPKWQRKGAGTLLIERLLSDLRGIGGELAWTSFVLPESPSSRFAVSQGFTRTRVEQESVLDLRSLDPRRGDAALARVRRDNIDVRTVAEELAHDAEAGRKLYELEMEAGEDVPRVVESENITFDEYSMVIFQNPTYLPRADFVAIAGDRYVGSSSLWRSGPEGYLTQGFTAVRKEYRRKGVATALKLLVAKVASGMGARFVRTSNDSANEPILRLNTQLGFVPTQAWSIYQKRLA